MVEKESVYGKVAERESNNGLLRFGLGVVHTGGGEHVGQHSKKILSNQLRQGA